MREIVYSYSNNGIFPFRYVKRAKRWVDHSQDILPGDLPGEIAEEKKRETQNSNLVKGFETRRVSIATRRKIAKSCRILAIASVKRRVRFSSGNFGTHLNAFITLTLPSDQIHSDQEVTKLVLGNFLDRCRKIGLLSNYVWRAEKQKSGNIHYHILTDSFAYFSVYRRIWYLALRAHGYMAAYSSKFAAMSFNEYSRQDFNKGCTPATVAARYARGSRNNWSEPPCVDVEYVDSVESVAKYVSKYISKNGEEDNNIVQGRSWAASQSVSQSVKSFCTDQELNKFWFHSGAEIIKRKVIDFDFFSICKFKFSSLVAWFNDAQQYVINLLKSHFSPCEYWRNSVGLFAT